MPGKWNGSVEGYEVREGSATRCHPSAGNSVLPACVDFGHSGATHHFTTQAPQTLTLVGVDGTPNITKW